MNIILQGLELVGLNRRPIGTDEPVKARAKAKRERKAALRLAHPYGVTPTNSHGPEFARAEVRRMDRRIRKRMKMAREKSATTAKARRSTAVGEKPRPKSKPIRLSPVPADFFKWEKARRRIWVNQREVDRQRSEMMALVRRGVPEAEARGRFGSL